MSNRLFHLINAGGYDHTSGTFQKFAEFTSRYSHLFVINDEKWKSVLQQIANNVAISNAWPSQLSKDKQVKQLKNNYTICSQKKLHQTRRNYERQGHSCTMEGLYQWNVPLVSLLETLIIVKVYFNIVSLTKHNLRIKFRTKKL